MAKNVYLEGIEKVRLGELLQEHYQMLYKLECKNPVTNGYLFTLNKYIKSLLIGIFTDSRRTEVSEIIELLAKTIDIVVDNEKGYLPYVHMFAELLMQTVRLFVTMIALEQK